MKMEEESKQKRVGGGVGDTIDMSWKVEIEVESRREVLW